MNEIFYLEIFSIDSKDNWESMCNGVYTSYINAMSKIDFLLLRDIRIHILDSKRECTGIIIQVAKERTNSPLTKDGIYIKFYRFDDEDFSTFYTKRYNKECFIKLVNRINSNLARRKFIIVDRNHIKDKGRFLYDAVLDEQDLKLLERYKNDQHKRVGIMSHDPDYLNFNVRI